MPEVSVWFERRFDFSFPAELYPNICARLRGTAARLEEIFRAQSGTLVIRKDGEKWSAQETAGHLLDLEPVWLARVEDFLAGRPDLTVADLTNRRTHEAGHNQRAIGDILTEFRSARSKLLGRVSPLPASTFGKTALHPRLKTPMRLVDHLYFIAEHDDHHLAQIWRMLISGR